MNREADLERVFQGADPEVADDGGVLAVCAWLCRVGQLDALWTGVKRQDNLGNRVIQEWDLAEINTAAEVPEIVPSLHSLGNDWACAILNSSAGEGKLEVPLGARGTQNEFYPVLLATCAVRAVRPRQELDDQRFCGRWFPQAPGPARGRNQEVANAADKSQGQDHGHRGGIGSGQLRCAETG